MNESIATGLFNRNVLRQTRMRHIQIYCQNLAVAVCPNKILYKLANTTNEAQACYFNVKNSQ